MKQVIRDYFIFTKKERKGIIVLSILILSIFLIPELIPKKTVLPNMEELQEWNEAYDRLHKKPQQQEGADADDISIERNSVPTTAASGGKQELFYFNPNTTSLKDWLRLGLREKTAAIILKYIARGGKFRDPVDLKKIYSLPEKDYQRLFPYIRIEIPAGDKHIPYLSEKTKDSSKVFRLKNIQEDLKIDINTADSIDFKKLRGIGSTLAARITLFRKKLGGFYAIDQVGETFGISDSLFQQLKPHLLLGQIATRKINLNEADVETLRQHPYIRWAIANNIVRYRTQHGLFTSVEELKQLHAVDSASLKKLAAYLTVDGD